MMITKMINREAANILLTLLLLLFSLSSCDVKKDKPVVKEAGKQSNVTNGRNGDPERGKIIYDKYCYYCHGREGRGDGAIGIAVTPHPADFVGDKRKMSKSDEELFKSISEGIRREVGSDEMAMPRWKDILSEDEIRDALAYVRQLAKGRK